MSSILLRCVQRDVAELLEFVYKGCAEKTGKRSFEDHTNWCDLVEYGDSASQVYIRNPTVSDRRLQPFVAPCILLRVLHNDVSVSSSAGSEFPFQFDAMATNGLLTAANYVCSRLSEVLVSTGTCRLEDIVPLVRIDTPMYNYVRLYELCEELRDLRHGGLYRWHASEELFVCCAKAPVYSESMVSLAHVIARNMLLSNALKSQLNSAQMLAVRDCVPNDDVIVESIFGMTSVKDSRPSDLIDTLNVQLEQVLHNATLSVQSETTIQEALNVACRLLACPTINARAVQ